LEHYYGKPARGGEKDEVGAWVDSVTDVRRGKEGGGGGEKEGFQMKTLLGGEES